MLLEQASLKDQKEFKQLQESLCEEEHSSKIQLMGKLKAKLFASKEQVEKSQETIEEVKKQQIKRKLELQVLKHA